MKKNVFFILVLTAVLNVFFSCSNSSGGGGDGGDGDYEETASLQSQSTSQQSQSARSVDPSPSGLMSKSFQNGELKNFLLVGEHNSNIRTSHGYDRYSFRSSSGGDISMIFERVYVDGEDAGTSSRVQTWDLRYLGNGIYEVLRITLSRSFNDFPIVTNKSRSGKVFVTFNDRGKISIRSVFYDTYDDDETIDNVSCVYRFSFDE